MAKILAGLTLIWVILPLSQVFAREVPRWELGMAVASASFPDYRGSGQRQNWMVPFPFFRFRSDYLEIDEAGARRWIYANDNMRLDISLAGGLPVPQDSPGVREGMPGLDPVAEIGPELELKVWRKKNQSVYLHVPWRFAISTDLSDVAYRGWMFPPFLYYSVDRLVDGHWSFGLAVGPEFADSGYHNYYYGVDDQYQTARRPSYSGVAGYSGSRATLFLERHWQKVWISAYIRYDNLDGAVFGDSPLVESNDFLVAGFVFGWLFAESEDRVFRKYLSAIRK